MKTIMFLGLAALAALVFLLLISSELKNKRTFSPDINSRGNPVARKSMEEDELGKVVYDELHEDPHLEKGQEIINPLYTQGGNGTVTLNSTNVDDLNAESLKELTSGQQHYNSYTMKKDRITQRPQYMRHQDKAWEKDEEDNHHVLAGAHHSHLPQNHVVTNRHTRHPAAAGH